MPLSVQETHGPILPVWCNFRSSSRSDTTPSTCQIYCGLLQHHSMRSMTGYGSGSAAFPGGRVTVEIRTVNHRFLELKMPLPREFLAYEQMFRELIESHLTRGKVDMFLTTTGKPPRRYTINVNLELARAYRGALTRLHRELGMSGDGDLSFLTAHPELFQIQEQSQATDAQA